MVAQRLTHRDGALRDPDCSVVIVGPVESQAMGVEGSPDGGIVETVVCVDEKGVALSCGESGRSIWVLEFRDRYGLERFTAMSR